MCHTVVRSYAGTYYKRNLNRWSWRTCLVDLLVHIVPHKVELIYAMLKHCWFFTNTQKYPKCISFSQFFYISLPKGRTSLLVHNVSHDVELMQWKFCGIWNSPKLKQGQMLLLSIRTQDFLMNVKYRVHISKQTG